MNASSLTEQILELRQRTDAFQESIRSRSEKMSWTFYDGPPFTSGDPHYGHLLQSIVKDMVPRRMTMRGYRVNRKRGWDCHGIPAENFVNKKLGITSKKQVEEEFGLQNYIEACRTMVNEVNTHRKWTVDHIGRWVDMDNAYFTMDNNFMESVICLFSDLYHRNLIYKGFKVLGYSRALGTALSNSEIAEGYEMRQDPAVTVKFPLANKPIEVVCGVIKDDQGRTLMIYENRHNARYFPGGKIEPSESPADALKREIREELGVDVKSEQFLGHAKTIHKSKLYRLHYFAITIDGTPTIQEPHHHGMLEWITKIPSENAYGYVLKFADNIISDEFALRHDFADIHMLEQGLIGHEKSGDAAVSILPWTTTPWTLPANMFAAVHRDIDYMQIFDKTSQEYYVLAEACIPKYFKSREEYIEVGVFKGVELIDMAYTPLFSYYHTSGRFAETCMQRVHHILHADFVTTESGTGIVHEAPAFGADDYTLVADHLGKDNAQEWLFDPVNEYGEFTNDATDFAGMNVFDANSEIIKDLKSRCLLIKQETYNHSYPHCPRTKTPLIYKAIESRFVKEEELKALTVPAVESMHMVPETVKNRFVEGLKSAPDRNISRTRFRGAPLPVWTSEDGSEKPIVLGSRDEIFRHASTGSKNITKFLFARHGETDYNINNGGRDAFGQAKLTDKGQNQAIDLMHTIIDGGHTPEVIVVSGFRRTFDTATPLLRHMYTDAIVTDIETKYHEYATRFAAYLRKNGFAAFFTDTNEQKCIQLHEGVYIDFRINELFINNRTDSAYFKPDIPGEYCPTRSDEPATPGGESMFHMYARTKQAIQEYATLFAGKTVCMVSHSAALRMMRMSIKEYDFEKLWGDKINRSNKHASCEIHYYDTTTKTEFDLHRPYIDNVRFMIDGKKYTRIPEVLDCRFESGSMPYGQDHFMKKEQQDFANCANFIAEGLDQTRGWFRALHVLGHAYHGQNVFQNVVVTGMILAEDGKKMSKSLQNFPDPTILINQYGADALRLYLLSSPVVRAEPLRFSEKGVEQMLKDVVIPLQNVFNFFKMYAEADKWKDDGTQVWFMRHALKAQINIKEETETGWITTEGETIGDIHLPLSENGFAQLTSPQFIEDIVRINPDVIVCSHFLRAQQTADGVLSVIEAYLGKKIAIEHTADRGMNAKANSEFDSYNDYESGEFDNNARPIGELYQELLLKYAGKRILIVSHKRRFRYLRQWLFNYQKDVNGKEARTQFGIESAQAIQLPLTPIHNELDQRVLAELHRTIIGVDAALQLFQLEVATNRLIEFVEKITNWYLRRSRRRFRTEEMTEDKSQAYQTLFTVLRTYLQICAPFAPFVTESLWQELEAFTSHGNAHPSIHLQSRPFASSLYINEQLIEEIETVRKIIKGALYLRAKHQVKVKQPLLELQCKV